MKKLLMMLLLLFGFVLNSQDFAPVNPQIVSRWHWNGYEHVVFTAGGHWYLEVRRGDAVSVIHYASCPCGRAH